MRRQKFDVNDLVNCCSASTSFSRCSTRPVWRYGSAPMTQLAINFNIGIGQSEIPA
jgi:hypothetical protein